MLKRTGLLVFVLAVCKIAQAQLLLPNMPAIIADTISGTVGNITAFEHDSAKHRLYIAGEFVRIGNVNRQGFAVIDLPSGNVLNTLTTISLRSLPLTTVVKPKLKINNNKLYVGGNFDGLGRGYLFSINLNDSSILDLTYDAPLSDFELYNGKIYTSGAFYNNAPDEFTVKELDTLGNILWQKSIVHSTNEHLSCLAVRNNALFIGGVFTSFGGTALKNLAKVTLPGHTITTWQPIPAPGPSGNVNCYDVTDLSIYPNDVFLNISTTTCGNPPNNIIAYDIASGNVNSLLRNIPYNYGKETLAYENDTSFLYANNNGLKLYGIKNYTTPWAILNNANTETYLHKAGYLFCGGNFTTLQGASHKGLGVFCLAPNAPKQQSLFAKACQGQSNVIYFVTAVKDAVSYNWSYTGSGCTIIGSGRTVTLNFSSTATSGTLQISANSYCGAVGDTLKIPFTVYSNPNVSVGHDIRFTCSHKIDTLYGASTSTGVSYAWNGPSGVYSTAAINQVSNTIAAGNYVLWVTGNISGCKSRDTVKVSYDTLAPLLHHNLTYGQLNCNTTQITLDAAPLYNPGDLLHWSGNSFSQGNPANITAPGQYTLAITSGTNDCISKDTFLITQNITPPNVTAPATLDTITCLHDSVQLPASTTTTSALLYWKDNNNDSLANNSYTHNSGVYTAHAIDTLNHCGSQLIRVIDRYTTPPVVNVPNGNFVLNCSYYSQTLNGNTPNAGATLAWSGSGGFSSANPATVNTPGTYYLTALLALNGCKAIDSVVVTRQNILLVNAGTDTSICNGSTGILNAAPIGGTPGFSYSWNNAAGSASSATVTPSANTAFIVTVTDNTGCTGSDTVNVMVPAALGDSVHTFQPCDPSNPNGQIQAYATGGIAPYVFALNGNAFQSSGVFTGLGLGSYTLQIKDSLGCQYSFTSVIDSLSVLPTPDFILSTTEIKGDTFVLVDISNPRPDSVIWMLPPSTQQIGGTMFAPVIVHSDTGAMQISMLAWFGTCQVQLTKNIRVMLPDTNIANAHNNNGIKDLTLYPNPNTGQFTVDVSFYKKQSFGIFVYDALGNELKRYSYSDTDLASAAVDLHSASPGTYVLKVIAQYDSRTRTFLITQQ